jgi:CheY-like chemotaxis protein
MPGINGLELQRRLNELGAGIPIVFVTAHDEACCRQRAIEAGAIDFLGKPFQPRKLLSTVETALRSVAPMSTPHIIHFGNDDCHRVMVLRNAGYTVHECMSAGQLARSFELGTSADMLCISEGLEPLPSEVFAAKAHCHVPVIYFRTSTGTYSDFKFDFEIEPLTPPNRWLSDIQKTLSAAHVGYANKMGRNMPSEFNNPRVLVVDDEMIIADTLVMILNRCGFDAHAVYSGEEALAYAATFAADILVSDVMMTGIDGIETAIRMRERLPDLRVLLFSGQAATANLLEGARARGHEFDVILKPVHPKDLLAKLRDTSMPVS